MQYLTQEEKKRIHLRTDRDLPPRELTTIEEVIKRLPGIYAMPVDTIEAVGKRAGAIKEVYDDLFRLTLTPRLGSKVKDALASQETLDAFMENYPYAKYEVLINADGPLSNIERMALFKFKLPELQKILQWIARIHVLYGKLPKGVDTFIWTPESRRWKNREMAALTGDKAYYGWLLSEEIQADVDRLLNFESISQYNVGEPGWLITHARNFDVANIPNVWKRADLEDVQRDFIREELKINFIHPKGPEGEWLPAQMELVDTTTNTRLRFFVPTP